MQKRQIINPRAPHTISPIGLLGSLVHNRQLIISLVKREVIGRYRGSILGILWSFFNPIFMLVVYTFVFSVVLKARWGAAVKAKPTSPSLFLSA